MEYCPGSCDDLSFKLIFFLNIKFNSFFVGFIYFTKKKKKKNKTENEIVLYCTWHIV
jgi:hypothetical protein